jgi:predicted ATPase
MSDSTFLKRVEIRNFKSIAHCDVRLGPLNFLVGPNGSGKTNFVDALRFVRDCMTGTLGQATLQQRGITTRAGASSIFFGLEVAGEVTGSYELELALSHAGGAQMLSERCELSGGSYSLVSGELSLLHSLPVAIPHNRPYLIGLSSIEPFDKLYRALASLAFYSPSPRLDIFRDGADETLEANGSNVTQVFDSLGPVAQADVQECLRLITPGVDSVKIEEFAGRKVLQFQVGQTWFLADSMSDGTLTALKLLVALAQPKVRSGQIPVVCIEEPEMGIHPGAMGVLLDAITEASETTQVIVTSHSPELLDNKHIPAESLLAVVMDGETRIGPVGEGFRDGIAKRLFTPGELLRSTQIEPESTAITS